MMADPIINPGDKPLLIGQQPFIPVAGGEPLVGVDFLLNAIGFMIPAECEHIIESGLVDYEDFHYLVEKDIQEMAEEFSKHTVAQGHITFSLSCTKKLTGLMHWVQDCFCTDDYPDYLTFNNKQLAEAQSRALIRKADIDLVDTNTKAADPGKFKEEHKWPEWSKAFMNYLSIIPGVNGIPHSYVILESEPEDGAVYNSFNEHMIARAPHVVGQYFEVDSR